MSTSDLKSRVRVTRKTGDDNIFKLVEGEKIDQKYPDIIFLLWKGYKEELHP